jgi:hypothetical protein
LGQTSIVLKGAAGEIFEISAPFAHRLDHGDDACAGERAADPLHRPRIDSELFGNHTHTGPARSGQLDLKFETATFERTLVPSA